jgi:hypothetical protein
VWLHKNAKRESPPSFLCMELGDDAILRCSERGSRRTNLKQVNSGIESKRSLLR